MQEIVAGRQEEDEEMEETAKEEKAAPLMLGSGSRYLAVNCCASYRVEVFLWHPCGNRFVMYYREVFLHQGIYTALCITSKSSRVLSLFNSIN